MHSICPTCAYIGSDHEHKCPFCQYDLSPKHAIGRETLRSSSIGLPISAASDARENDRGHRGRQHEGS
jgi:hypothetical protein